VVAAAARSQRRRHRRQLPAPRHAPHARAPCTRSAAQCALLSMRSRGRHASAPWRRAARSGKGRRPRRRRRTRAEASFTPSAASLRTALHHHLQLLVNRVGGLLALLRCHGSRGNCTLMLMHQKLMLFDFWVSFRTGSAFSLRRSMARAWPLFLSLSLSLSLYPSLNPCIDLCASSAAVNSFSRAVSFLICSSDLSAPAQDASRRASRPPGAPR